MKPFVPIPNNTNLQSFNHINKREKTCNVNHTWTRKCINDYALERKKDE